MRTFVLPCLVWLSFLSGCAFAQSLHEVELTPEQAVALDVFSEDSSAEPIKGAKKVRQFFKRLSRATRARKEIDGGGFLSEKALFGILEEEGFFSKLSPEGVESVRKRFGIALAGVGLSFKTMAYDHFKLLKVEKLGEGRQVVYVRHYDDDLNVTTQIRWWLVEEEGRLLAYDFEDLSCSLRMSRLMSIGFSPVQGGEAASWVKILGKVVETMNQGDLTDPDTWLLMEKPLKKLAGLELPRDIESFVSAMMVGLHQMKGESEEGLAELLRVRVEGIGSPLWHYQRASILMMEESYVEALEEFATHAKTLGWDCDVLEMVSDCYFELNLLGKAREAALRGLADNPRSWACAASLAAASTEEELLADFPKIYQEGGKNEEFYELSLDYLLDLEQFEKASSFYASYQEQVKESDLFEYYDESFADLEAE